MTARDILNLRSPLFQTENLDKLFYKLSPLKTPDCDEVSTKSNIHLRQSFLEKNCFYEDKIEEKYRNLSKIYLNDSDKKSLLKSRSPFKSKKNPHKLISSPKKNRSFENEKPPIPSTYPNQAFKTDNNKFLRKRVADLTRKYLGGEEEEEEENDQNFNIDLSDDSSSELNFNNSEKKIEKHKTIPNIPSRPTISAKLRRRTINLEDKKRMKDNKKNVNNKEEGEVNPKKELALTKKENLSSNAFYKSRVIITKKCDPETIEFVLKSKYTLDNSKNMTEYLKKLCLDPKTKVFCCNSQDQHIRRVLLGNGWFENKNTNSVYFHLKWTYTDSEQDYKYLLDGQFMNHFNNNKELTTKISLSMNLKNFCDFGINHDDFYPRCYDLGDSKEVQDFEQDFQRTSLLNLLKKHIKYFKIKKKALYIKVKQEIRDKVSKKKKGRSSRKKAVFAKYYNFYNKDQEDGFLVNTMLIETAVLYYNSIYKQIEDLNDERSHFDLDKISKSNLSDLLIYSNLNIPYENLNPKNKV